MSKSFFNAATLLVVVATASPLLADSAATVPAGALPISIPANSTATFSIPLRENVPTNFTGQAVGRFTSVYSARLLNSNAGWITGKLFVGIPQPYFIRITSGEAAGRTLLITANSKNSLNVNTEGTDLTTLGIKKGANGDTYEIFPGDTLSSLFGTSTLAGTSAATADVVRIHDGSNWTEYYFSSTFNTWRSESSSGNMDKVVLRPDAGITFYRRGTTDLDFVILGIVPSTPIRVVVNNGGTTYLGNVFPVDDTLAAAGFNSLNGWVGAGPVALADKIVIGDGTSNHQYHSDLAAEQWRIGSASTNHNNLMIPASVPVIMERPTAAAGVTTLVRDLPYDLNP